MIQVTTKPDFNRAISATSGIKLVNVWAFWCDGCLYMFSLMPYLNASLDNGDRIVYIDWDQNKKLAKELCVYGVPSLLVYQGKNEVARYSGTTDVRALQNWIDHKKHREAPANALQAVS